MDGIKMTREEIKKELSLASSKVSELRKLLEECDLDDKYESMLKFKGKVYQDVSCDSFITCFFVTDVDKIAVRFIGLELSYLANSDSSNYSSLKCFNSFDPFNEDIKEITIEEYNNHFEEVKKRILNISPKSMEL